MTLTRDPVWVIVALVLAAVTGLVSIGGFVRRDALGNADPRPDPTTASVTASAGAHRLGQPRPRRLPLAFVENRGQWDPGTRFVARRGGVTTRLEDSALVTQLFGRTPSSDAATGVVVRLAFEGTAAGAPRGVDTLPGVHHFLLGDDPSAWRRDVPGFRRVIYDSLYEGIDLQVREGAGGIEYDLLLEPGADLGEVVIRCDGSESIAFEPSGDVLIHTALGIVRQSPPRTWEVLPDGSTRAVESRCRRIGPQRFGFSVERVNPALALVLDPAIEWSTFIGGNDSETFEDVVLNREGRVLLGGWTGSNDFPVTAGVYQAEYGGAGDPFFCCDVILTCLDPTGSSLVFSTYLGGFGADRAHEMVCDSDGTILFAGETNSPDFPITPGSLSAETGGFGAAIVARLSTDGSQLLMAAAFGGVQSDDAESIALASNGDIVVAGTTLSADFPTTAGAFAQTFGGGSADCFLLRMTGDGTALVYSTFLGGERGELWARVLLDDHDRPLVCARTASDDFPVTEGAFKTIPDGTFVTQLDADGASLVASTFLGGEGGSDWPLQVAFGPRDEVVVVGETRSGAFPVTPEAFDTVYSAFLGPNGFVACFTPDLSDLVYATYIGNGDQIHPLDAHVNSAGEVTLFGWTRSEFYPTTPGAFAEEKLSPSIGIDNFVSRLSPDGSSLYYSTYFGSVDGESGLGSMTVDETGSVVVATGSNSPDFPISPNAFQKELAIPGELDAAVSKLTLLPRGARKLGRSTPGCAGPLAVGITAMPNVGNADVRVTCTNAPRGSTAGLLAMSSGALSAPVTVKGAELWIDPSALVLVRPASSDDVGYAVVPTPIPDVAELIDVGVVLQFFWPDACDGGLSASNALGVTFQP